MPAHQAMANVERVKNEIHQRRIPTRTGGGANIMDAQYNPLSIMEDYFFAQTAEGRGVSSPRSGPRRMLRVAAGSVQFIGEITGIDFFQEAMRMVILLLSLPLC